jgi:predicted transcriptional regulator
LQRVLLSIREDAKKRKISNKIIAKKLNISEGMVSNYFNLIYRIPFNKLIELLIMVYEDKKQIDKCINDFLDKTNKMDNIKEAAEWFATNGDFQRLSNLVKKYKKDECIFAIYDLFLKRNKRKIDKKEFYRSVEMIRENGVTNPEAKILCRIAQSYSHLDFKAYTTLEFLASDTLLIIEKLNKGFIQTSYKLRCYELLAIAHLARKDVKKAEEIVRKALSEADEDTFPVPVSSFLNLLSEIYVFSNFDHSIQYNREAFNVFKKAQNGNLNRLSILQATHDFIKIHHHDFSDLFLTDPSEKAHLLAKMGGEKNVKLSLEILNELEKENGLSPFQMYYKGLALKDHTLLEQSEYEFISRGNLFYSTLPKNAIRELSLGNFCKDGDK